MATCHSCGSDVNGAYCNTCGAKVQDERAPKKQAKESKPAAKPTAKASGGFAPKNVTRMTAMGLLGIALFGAGMVTGFYLGGTPTGGSTNIISAAEQTGDLTGLPPVALASKYMDEGVAYLEKGERSAAISTFRKAVQQYELVLKEEPDNLYAQSYMGLTYYYMGDSNKAVTTLRAVLEKDTNYLWAIFNLAWIYETAGKTTEAQLMYQKYVAVAPTEKENLTKYAEQVELIDRQMGAATAAIEKLKGGSGK